MEYCLGSGLELLSTSLVLAVCQDSNARDFIHNIGLKFGKRPKLGRRKLLLQGLVMSSKNIYSILSNKTCDGFCNTTNIRKASHSRGFIFNQIEKHAHATNSISPNICSCALVYERRQWRWNYYFWRLGYLKNTKA